MQPQKLQWEGLLQGVVRDGLNGAGWNFRRIMLAILKGMMILKLTSLIKLLQKNNPSSFVSTHSINADTGTTGNFISLPDAVVLLDITQLTKGYLSLCLMDRLLRTLILLL